jgi:hypothetical protein
MDAVIALDEGRRMKLVSHNDLLKNIHFSSPNITKVDIGTTSTGYIVHPNSMQDCRKDAKSRELQKRAEQSGMINACHDSSLIIFNLFSLEAW